MMSSSNAVASAVPLPATEAIVPGEQLLRMPPCDVRLRREITHRRMAISLLRRLLRLVSLHVLDAGLLIVALLLTATVLPSGADVGVLLPAIVGTFVLSLNAMSAYAAGDPRRDRRRFASASGLAALLLTVLVVFPPHLELRVDFLAAFAVTAFVVLCVGRALADRLVRLAYARGIGLRRAVLVGTLDEVGAALHGIRNPDHIDQYVVGHLAVDGSDPSALGTLDDLARVIEEHEVEEVLVATALPAGTMRRLTAACFERGAAVFVLPSVMSHVECWTEPIQVGSFPLLRLHPSRLEMPALMIKRGVDVVLALVALVLLAPLIALIALAIRVDSAGPVFFRQTRVGLGGRRFTMWKFRSMTTDAEQRLCDLEHLNIYGAVGPFKLPGDPRITRVGAILRRTSLDELPQLINVLRGDMSLVGPRPLPSSDLERMRPWHYERLSVVPGLTGPWQVGGRNLVTDFEQIVRLERDYIAKWSLLLDFKIMFRTVGVVVRGDGAY
jgi:exopolysaccharide biosynthesis polyprenyl glycosylphosphotransferase